eukprot:1828513-Pyramimonas_sp.AAC.1
MAALWRSGPCSTGTKRLCRPMCCGGRTQESPHQEHERQGHEAGNMCALCFEQGPTVPAVL